MDGRFRGRSGRYVTHSASATVCPFPSDRMATLALVGIGSSVLSAINVPCLRMAKAVARIMRDVLRESSTMGIAVRACLVRDRMLGVFRQQSGKRGRKDGMTALYYVVAALLGVAIGMLAHAVCFGVAWLFGADFAVSVWWFAAVGAGLALVVSWLIVWFVEWVIGEVKSR